MTTAAVSHRGRRCAWPVSTTRSTAWACASGPAARVAIPSGVSSAATPLRQLLGTCAGEHDMHLEALLGGQLDGERTPASSVRPDPDGPTMLHARTTADRRQVR